MSKKKPVHVARKVQASALRGEEPTEYPKAAWWREDVHGATARAARVEQRRAGKLNRRFRSVGPQRGIYYLAFDIMKRDDERRSRLL